MGRSLSYKSNGLDNGGVKFLRLYALMDNESSGDCLFTYPLVLP